jgi:two-component system sensor kinase FixL
MRWHLIARPIRADVIETSLDGASSVRVAVRDCCPGLAGDIVEKLFLPFVTSKRDGLGLGLSTSRSIVGMHGGRIWAENNPDGGATFYFTLPSESVREAASSGGTPMNNATQIAFVVNVDDAVRRALE